MTHPFRQVAALVFLSFVSPITAQTPWSARPEMIASFNERSVKQGGGFNYDEAAIPEFHLPDPLRLSSGAIVKDAEQWKSLRRAELLDLFRGEVYGERPETAFTMSFEEVERRNEVFGGAATGMEMKATVRIGDRSFAFPFVVFVPNDRSHPVPAVVHINNRYFVPLEKAAKENDPFWPVRKMIERGYATASFHTSDVDPDRKDGYEEGIRSFFANGAPPEESDWRSLSAWGWAASRILDFLGTIDEIDSERIAVSGHSRGGKSALWAACEDSRFAISYSNNSGCGGAALSRRAYGETVKRITSSFPHWFCPRFSSYADRLGELPVDQHEVMALIAPRGVYVASADEDLWADPRGEYASVVAAAPVFEMLGVTAISEPEMPQLDQPRVVGKTGYHVRTGGHNLGEQDWKWFLDFADSLWN